MIEWRDIPGHRKYQVSSDGQVFSKRVHRVLALEKVRGGYLRVALGFMGNRHLVHRLVLLAFVGPSELECNHKNGIRSDNRIENLEYCTRQENNLHCCRVLKSRIGENHHNARFSSSDIETIRSLWKNGTKQTEIAKLFNARQGTINNIISGRSRLLK